MRYSSPAALVQGLQNHSEGAREQFQIWMREPVQRLMSQLIQEHQLDHDLDRLVRYALHAAETYIRTFTLKNIRDLSENAFRATILVYLAKFVLQPFGRELKAGDPPNHLPEITGYQFQTVFLPYEKIGSFWFGGDWFGSSQSDDGSLWLMVADITGHGYCAYLLANTLPGLWEQCWSNGAQSGKPLDLLRSMHHLVEQCLPEGVFIECTLLRLDPNGQVLVAPAGGTRLFLRSRRLRKLDLLKLRGIWLGLGDPMEDDQHCYQLEDGDELIVGSDGFFDQMVTHLGAVEELKKYLEQVDDASSLSVALQQHLDDALLSQPQEDDITIVIIRRQ